MDLTEATNLLNKGVLIYIYTKGYPFLEISII